MVNLIITNKELIRDLSNPVSSKYVDLPKYLEKFEYPVSLHLAEYIGQKAYQRGTLDQLEFLCILTNKMYANILQQRDNPFPSLENFILREKESFEEKASKLIEIVRKWDVGIITNNQLASEIEEFCSKTYGVRLPVISFFLRMLMPNKFATLDVRVTNVLKNLGFKGIKEIPKEEQNKTLYFQEYSGLDYLEYNELITEMGRCYNMQLRKDEMRIMMPAEVDMALYTYDKIGITEKYSITLNLDPIRKKKIDEIMKILVEIRSDVYNVANEDWAFKTGWSGKLKGSADKLMREMEKYANEGNLEGIMNYYVNAMGDDMGKNVARILQEKKKKSLESEYDRVKTIFYKS